MMVLLAAYKFKDFMDSLDRLNKLVNDRSHQRTEEERSRAIHAELFFSIFQAFEIGMGVTGVVTSLADRAALSLYTSIADITRHHVRGESLVPVVAKRVLGNMEFIPPEVSAVNPEVAKNVAQGADLISRLSDLDACAPCFAPPQETSTGGTLAYVDERGNRLGAITYEMPEIRRSLGGDRYGDNHRELYRRMLRQAGLFGAGKEHIREIPPHIHSIYFNTHRCPITNKPIRFVVVVEGKDDDVFYEKTAIEETVSKNKIPPSWPSDLPLDLQQVKRCREIQQIINQELDRIADRYAQFANELDSRYHFSQRELQATFNFREFPEAFSRINAQKILDAYAQLFRRLQQRLRNQSR